MTTLFQAEVTDELPDVPDDELPEEKRKGKKRI